MNRQSLEDTEVAYFIFPNSSSYHSCGLTATSRPQQPGNSVLGGRKRCSYSGAAVFQVDIFVGSCGFCYLGPDFLKYHQLAVYLHSRKLVDRGDVRAAYSGRMAAVVSSWRQWLQQLPSTSSYSVISTPSQTTEKCCRQRSMMLNIFWKPMVCQSQRDSVAWMRPNYRWQRLEFTKTGG